MVKLLTAGLVSLALGLMLASGVVASRAASGRLVGYAITGGAALLVYFTKLNPLVWIALGMIAFLLFGLS